MEKNKVKKLEKQGIFVSSNKPGEWVVDVDEPAKAKVETFHFLQELPNVVAFHFHESFAISDPILTACLGFCPNLRNLSINNARQLSRIGLGEISKLKSLRIFSITHIGFSLPELFKANISKGLIDLNLWGTNLNDSMTHLLVDAFPKLKRLHAQYTKLGPRGIKELAKLKQLKGLELDGCKLSDDCFDSLVGIKQLKLVFLLNTKVTQPAAEKFARKKRTCLVTMGDVFDMVLFNEDKWDEKKYTSLFNI